LLKAADELDTQIWASAFSQAAELGVLQAHLSGGEPALRPDLEQLVSALSSRGVYTNLITAGVTLTHDRIKQLAARGLDHIQLSLQAVDAAISDKIGNYKDSLTKKLAVAQWVRAEGLPLTINAPTHRHNIGQTQALIELALELGADRLEIAHVQYYGWARRNEAALMPPYERVLEEAATIADARERLNGILSIDYVTPDYYAQFPKPCMGGWAKDVLNITPEGKVLPCHAAESLPLSFDNIKDRPLSQIWYESEAFNRFRGLDWMKEPCRSCPRKEIDFGGCRCQAFAITGDAQAADPACSLSSHHHLLSGRASAHTALEPPPFIYRRIGQA
jgi:pyrroloquinoline quinone biosynthesis protein E